MQAVGITCFGGPEVMAMMELPKPQPGPGEILVKIKAAGVNPVDWKIREGLLKDRMPYEFPIVLGWDASGVVAAVGAEVKDFQPGDEVFAYCRKDNIHDGTYAEWIALETKHLALKPKNLSFAEAAAIPLAGLTAYQSLFEALKLKSGETILIHAGAGGVGGYAIQLAKNAGAHVLTTASAGHHGYVKSLGADEIIDHRQEDFVRVVLKKYPEGIAAVFDTVGGEVQKRSAELLKPGGRIVSLLAIDPATFEDRGLKAYYVFVRPVAEHLSQLKALAEAGKLKVKLAAEFPLLEFRKAHELIQTGRTEGKIVLKIK